MFWEEILNNVLFVFIWRKFEETYEKSVNNYTVYNYILNMNLSRLLFLSFFVCFDIISRHHDIKKQGSFLFLVYMYADRPHNSVIKKNNLPINYYNDVPHRQAGMYYLTRLISKMTILFYSLMLKTIQNNIFKIKTQYMIKQIGNKRQLAFYVGAYSNYIQLCCAFPHSSHLYTGKTLGVQQVY